MSARDRMSVRCQERTSTSPDPWHRSSTSETRELQSRITSVPREMSHDAMSRAPRVTDTFRWRLAIGAVLIAGGYAAWLIIPLVAASDLSPSVKTALTAFFGATPLLTKLIAIALLGRPTINFLKRHSFKLFREDSAGGQ
jgi:hypothetical protein